MQIDALGIFLLSVSFLILGIGTTEAPTWGWTSVNFFLSMVIFLALFVIFVYHISRSKNPVIGPDDFKNPNIAVPLLSLFVTRFGLFLTFQSLVFIFELPKPIGYGIDILHTGETIAPIAHLMLVAGPFFGSTTNKVGYKKVILVSFTVPSLPLVSAYIISLKISMIELMFFLSIVLFFASRMNVSRVTLLIASTDRDKMSTLTGTNTAIRLLGNTLISVVVGSLGDAFKTPLFEGYTTNVPMFTFVPSRSAFEYAFLISMVTVVMFTILATRIREKITTERLSL